MIYRLAIVVSSVMFAIKPLVPLAVHNFTRAKAHPQIVCPTEEIKQEERPDIKLEIKQELKVEVKTEPQQHFQRSSKPPPEKRPRLN